MFLLLIYLMLTEPHKVGIYLCPPDADADKLVKILGDDNFRKRECAHQALVDKGYDAINAVCKGVSNPDPEISRRCKFILDSFINIDISSYYRIFVLPYGAERFEKKIKIIDQFTAMDIYDIVRKHNKEDEVEDYFSDIVGNQALKVYFQLLILYGVKREELINMKRDEFRSHDYPLNWRIHPVTGVRYNLSDGTPED